MKRTVTLSLTVEYDEDKVSVDTVLDALDIMKNTALSTPGLLDDLGEVEISDFDVAEEPMKPETAAALRKMLDYSFKPIQYSYSGLTTEEQKLWSPDDFARVLVWLKELK